MFVVSLFYNSRDFCVVLRSDGVECSAWNFRCWVREKSGEDFGSQRECRRFYMCPACLILGLERSRARAILRYSRLYPESLGRVVGPHLRNRQRVCDAFKGDNLLVVHTVRLAYSLSFCFIQLSFCSNSLGASRQLLNLVCARIVLH